jgi:transposase
MEYGAIDLHLKTSLIRIVAADGAVVLDRTIATTRDGFTQVFGDRAPLRVLLESGTESEWVAQTLEACGHAVIVADPNYALMYGQRARRIKTDRRDVAALAEACRLGIYRAAHRVSAAQREARRVVRIREQLVRMRPQTINQLRAQLRQEGRRLPRGTSESVVARLDALALPEALRVGLAPLRAVLASLAPLIRAATAEVGARASADPVVRRLLTVPGIGPITAVTYRAALDTWERFGDAGAATAFLGWVPREDSSGTRHRKGAITKAGPGPVRALLVQAAWVVWRQRQGRAALHAWVERLAARRGRRIAVVALARRLARILFAVWRDETEYQAVPSAAAA